MMTLERCFLQCKGAYDKDGIIIVRGGRGDQN